MTGVGWNWGATEAERRAAYACDDLVAGPRWACFRAIDVDAPAACVYRWLCQLRVAPYSYDLIDNLGRRSPRELTPGLGAPEPGDVAMTIFRVASREPGREISFVLSPPPGRAGRLVARIAPPGAVTYRVAARGAARSRIVVKYVNADPPGLRGRIVRTLLPAGDLVMMRRQLMNLRALAERDARRAGVSGTW